MKTRTQLEGAMIGIERVGDNWRLTIGDEDEMIWLDIPDPVARALALKIQTGKHIEIAESVPKPQKPML